MSTRPARSGLTSALRVGQRAATLAALAVAGAILLGYQIVAQRQALSDDINVQAAIIADNIAASLMFHDRDAATEMLRSFRPAPFLDAAAVYGADGQLFAVYHSAARHHGLLAPELTVEHRVAYRGSALGTVVLTADTAGVRNGVLRYAGLLALAALGALLATRAVSRRTHERVEQAERELAYLAYTDPVTTLPNRRASYERLEQELAACGAGAGLLGLLLIDLDNFKVVNDTAGHAAGDRLLCQVAAVLRATARATDLVGRIGGDEFVVVAAPLAGRAELAALAERIVEALRAPLQLAGVEVRATASVGACMFPDDGADMTELLCNADAALYHAKGSGKDQIAQFRREMIMATQRRAQIERDLRRAIDDDALDVHYQPQFKCAGGQLVGVEALLRWTHPEHGRVPPCEFIAVAEQSGLILDLGKWVLRRACRDAAALHAHTGLALNMAVNVSARQLREKDFVQFVRDTLEASGLPADRLELELTESMLMDDLDAALEFMEAVRALGVRLSIDDFGTGYSSLAYLQSFPLNHLKIDRSFVRQLPEAGGAIASAVIALAHRFNLTVVAEGVEQPAQLEWLRAAGCDFVQGYLTGRPVPLDALREQLLHFEAAVH